MKNIHPADIKYEEFVQFVKSKPPEEEINHMRIPGWCGCAVGEFIQTKMDLPIGVHDSDVQRAAVEFTRNHHKSDFPMALEQVLSAPYRSAEIASTYGDLANLIDRIEKLYTERPF